MVETRAGEVSGSAVVEVDGDMQQLPGSGNEINFTLRGGAIVAGPMPGRYIFAPLGRSEERSFAPAQVGFPGLSRAKRLQRLPGQTEPVSLMPDHVPMLVTLDDVTRPKTVREADPADLASVFGKGVRLQASTLEITKDEVKVGRVEGVMGLWAKTQDKQLDRDREGSIRTRFLFANSFNWLGFLREGFLKPSG